MHYYIGADLGTSALKLLLVDTKGQICRSVSRSYPISYPRPGWSEQEPAHWWSAFTEGIRELTAGISGIRGLALGGQMHGLVILDDEDQVIRPAILWNDGRTQKETDWLNQQQVTAYTGNMAFAGFTAPKLLWLKANKPESFEKIRKIMLPKDYLNYRLTGVHATDYSDASGMLLLDVKNKCWSQKMMEICGISEEQLPQLYESYQPIGGLLPEIAARLNLPAGLPVMAGAGDNAAAAVGTGTVRAGGCNISLGTSGTVFIPSDTFSADPFNALHAFCHANGGYHLMGCILSAASCNKWFCEEILKTDDYAAEQVSITEEQLGNNHVFFLPYLMGERSPINDTDARGVFLGMRMDTGRSHLVQAVLEGVAFAIRDNLEVSGISVRSSSLCGGGARSELWQKILCNVLGIPLHLPQTEEGPGYGAAMLAMVGCGEYESIPACADRLVQAKTVIKPDPALVARYEERYRRFKEIYPCMKGLFKKLK